MLRYGGIILPQYYEQKDEHDIVQAIHTYHDKFHTVPADADDLVDMVPEHGDVVKAVYLLREDSDLRYTADKIVAYCRQQAAKLAVLESISDINDGDLDSMMERLQKARRVGEDIGDRGLDVKRDVDKWLYESRVNKVPTGLTHLDIAMDGGLGKGEMGIILGAPNMGKSMALVNIGYGVAGPITRGNVVHFTLEMPDHVVAKRYSARMIFKFPSRSEDGAAQYKEEFEVAAKMLMPGDVRVFRVSGTILDLRAKLDMIANEGFEPTVIIVDYGDELKPVRSRESTYQELGDIFHDIRELGSPDSYDCPVWTATQAGRQALGKETVTMADLAESFKKAAVADAIIAICQTTEEEAAQQCRIFLAKLRDGESRAMLRAKYYKQSQAIITTGFV
jgi:replicative DNA helicase